MKAPHFGRRLQTVDRSLWANKVLHALDLVLGAAGQHRVVAEVLAGGQDAARLQCGAGDAHGTGALVAVEVALADLGHQFGVGGEAVGVGKVA